MVFRHTSGGGVRASANPSFSLFWVLLFYLVGLLGQGLGLGLEPWLDNYLDQSEDIITCGDGAKQICRYKSRTLQGIHM